MTYADGEKVEYGYNVGGLLRSMKGKKKGTEYKYVQQLGYDKFEQRVFLHYGNGTKTTYDYEPDRRRLKGMVAKTANGRAMMDNVYQYDKVTNILSLKNKELALYRKAAQKDGIQFKVVDSAKEISNYVNSRDVSDSKFSKSGERGKD